MPVFTGVRARRRRSAERAGRRELDGKMLTLTVAGESMECTLSGGTITVEEDGATLELKK